jgi:penicillin-binding protein-related factor A (putative recombinase)
MNLETKFKQRQRVYWIEGYTIYEGHLEGEEFRTKYFNSFDDDPNNVQTAVNHLGRISTYDPVKHVSVYFDKESQTYLIPIEFLFETYEDAIAYNQKIFLCKCEEDLEKFRKQEFRRKKWELERELQDVSDVLGNYTGPVCYATVTDTKN